MNVSSNLPVLKCDRFRANVDCPARSGRPHRQCQPLHPVSWPPETRGRKTQLADCCLMVSFINYLDHIDL